MPARFTILSHRPLCRITYVPISDLNLRSPTLTFPAGTAKDYRMIHKPSGRKKGY